MLDKHGHEIPDPTPRALPTGFKRPETLAEQIQRMVRTHVSVAAEQAGVETFSDADDFDTDDDDDDPSTPYEMEFDPVLGREVSPEMMATAPETYKRAYLKALEDDEEFEDKVQRHYEKHVTRAGRVPPKGDPSDPGPSDKKRQDEKPAATAPITST